MQSLFRDQGYELIYTPPYSPNLQPIETVWAMVKNHVAHKFRRGRKMAQLLEDTRAGFYGTVESKYKGVTAEACQSIIAKCHNFANRIIENDDLLEGTIENLKYVSPHPKPVEPNQDDSESDFSECEESDSEWVQDD